jgi:4-hydroxybenzoate polyprenyltransferase
MDKRRALFTKTVDRIVVWGRLVKFSHTIFALPFALSVVALLWQEFPISLAQIFLIVACVVSARFAAMAFNRLVDQKLDADNPRTAMREIPQGTIRSIEVLMLVILFSVVFIVSACALSSLCGYLSVPVLMVLLGYSYCKRFSLLCHAVLGMSLALAPGGVWLAITGEFSWRPVPLMVAVLTWVAGFDIIYALQDIEFDRARGLRSIPARLGYTRAQICAGVFHVGTVIAMLVSGIWFDVGVVCWIGIVCFAVLIATQHISLAQDPHAQIEPIFFLRNGLASVIFFLCTLLDILIR